MSNGSFALTLGVGAPLLAVWIHARFPSLAPERFGRTMVHAVAAFFVLELATQVGDSTLTAFGAIVFVMLPALVYALLCSLWVMRLAQTALGLSR